MDNHSNLWTTIQTTLSNAHLRPGTERKNINRVAGPPPFIYKYLYNFFHNVYSFSHNYSCHYHLHWPNTHLARSVPSTLSHCTPTHFLLSCSCFYFFAPPRSLFYRSLPPVRAPLSQNVCLLANSVLQGLLSFIYACTHT